MGEAAVRKFRARVEAAVPAASIAVTAPRRALSAEIAAANSLPAKLITNSELLMS